MAKFRKTVITSIGLAIIAKSMQGLIDVEFTNVGIGNGEYTGTENLENSTTLISEKNLFQISNVSMAGDNLVKVKCNIINDNVLIGYNLTEIGIYAKDENDNDALFAIATAIESDYFPDFSSAPMSIIMELYVKINNSENVNLTYTVPSGIYATLDDIPTALPADGGNADTVCNYAIAVVSALPTTQDPNTIYLVKKS